MHAVCHSCLPDAFIHHHRYVYAHVFAQEVKQCLAVSFLSFHLSTLPCCLICSYFFEEKLDATKRYILYEAPHGTVRWFGMRRQCTQDHASPTADRCRVGCLCACAVSHWPHHRRHVMPDLVPQRTHILRGSNFGLQHVSHLPRMCHSTVE